ncbi:uncharacterized protein DS421_5g136200 [Arachis hypogaea]|nr:uncharacterized protein DS421_5g136200 [Arachis hypogaea]
MAQTKIVLAFILLAFMLIHHYYSIHTTSSLDSAEDEANMWCLPPPLDQQQMPRWQLSVKLPCRHLRATVLLDFSPHSMVLAVAFHIPFTNKACASLGRLYTF